MQQTKNARRAVIGACIALFGNMGLNSTFSIFLPSFMAEWGEENMATIALSIAPFCRAQSSATSSSAAMDSSASPR